MDSQGIDETDRIILQVLLRDARTPVRSLASQARVSVGTVVNRIHHLEDSGIIKRYTISVDYEALGYDIVVITTLKIAKGKFPEVANELGKEKNIITIYDVTGEYDAVVISVFPSRSELDAFLKRVQSHSLIEKTHTVLVLKTTKESEITLL